MALSYANIGAFGCAPKTPHGKIAARIRTHR